jgi:hypothetical protein
VKDEDYKKAIEKILENKNLTEEILEKILKDCQMDIHSITQNIFRNKNLNENFLEIILKYFPNFLDQDFRSSQNLFTMMKLSKLNTKILSFFEEIKEIFTLENYYDTLVVHFFKSGNLSPKNIEFFVNKKCISLEDSFFYSTSNLNFKQNTLDFYFQKKIDLNHKNSDNKTPIMNLCKNNNANFELIKCFVENKAEINLKDNKNICALEYYCSRNLIDFKTFQYLFDKTENSFKKDLFSLLCFRGFYNLSLFTLFSKIPDQNFGDFTYNPVIYF